MRAVRGKFYNGVTVNLELPEEDAAVRFVAKRGNTTLDRTIYAFAQGRRVGGCRTIAEAVAAWKQARDANSA